MKTITINVSEPVYRDFQEHARRHDRTTSELIREAMEQYRFHRIRPRTTLRELRPASVGRMLRELPRGEDLGEDRLGEMLDDPGS